MIVELDENKLEDKFNSSTALSSNMSSGNVTKLFPYRSRFFSFLRLKRLLKLAGDMLLYERFRVSSFGKSSYVKGGIV